MNHKGAKDTKKETDKRTAWCTSCLCGEVCEIGKGARRSLAGFAEQRRSLFVACALVLSASIAHSQGLTPDEAVARMTLPDGFEVSVVASEPLVRQPVAIEFDDRGRLWVIQYLQYPNPEGLKRDNVATRERSTTASPSRRRAARAEPTGSRFSKTPTATAGWTPGGISLTG